MAFSPAAGAAAFLLRRALGARSLGGLAVRLLTRERAEARATAACKSQQMITTDVIKTDRMSPGSTLAPDFLKWSCRAMEKPWEFYFRKSSYTQPSWDIQTDSGEF